MSHYRISRSARDDVSEIYRYIAQQSLRAADSVLSTFHKHFQLLAKQPLMGESRPDLAVNIRLISVDQYVILFRPAKQGVEIVQVVHSARDLQAVFRKPGS